jgi:hypothetical protein
MRGGVLDLGDWTDPRLGGKEVVEEEEERRGVRSELVELFILLLLSVFLTP